MLFHRSKISSDDDDDDFHSAMVMKQPVVVDDDCPFCRGSKAIHCPDGMMEKMIQRIGPGTDSSLNASRIGDYHELYSIVGDVPTATTFTSSSELLNCAYFCC